MSYNTSNTTQCLYLSNHIVFYKSQVYSVFTGVDPKIKKGGARRKILHVHESEGIKFKFL